VGGVGGGGHGEWSAAQELIGGGLELVGEAATALELQPAITELGRTWVDRRIHSLS